MAFTEPLLGPPAPGQKRDFAERTGWIRVEYAGRGDAIKIDQKGRVIVICSSTSDLGSKLPMVIRYLR